MSTANKIKAKIRLAGTLGRFKVVGVGWLEMFIGEYYGYHMPRNYNEPLRY